MFKGSKSDGRKNTIFYEIYHNGTLDFQDCITLPKFLLLDITIIVGIVLGAALLLTSAIIIIIVCCRKKFKSGKKKGVNSFKDVLGSYRSL
ncbi:MAG: hypothetical protein EZS28_044302 [Streblomastix strix]|uniref:Uncharacterized protein n=1 Tax=Streblomastix strix TaxID=222440 RepID=A0A5J4TRT7_9EUKA|nr:MAG: hypothetical protein EZS28_044302 [Streblomastix strix]